MSQVCDVLANSLQNFIINKSFIINGCMKYTTNGCSNNLLAHNHTISSYTVNKRTVTKTFTDVASYQIMTAMLDHAGHVGS